jgi:hypothetical protein
VHAANSTMQVLSKFFGGHFVSWNLWPPRSITTGFLSLGVFKENIYKNKLYTLEEFKQNIELCISNVTAEFFTGLYETWEKALVHASLNVVDISST